ncbi:MAG TPA: tetratricopeptide repeat protein [Pyrinomonadaceae bacterium]|nr:tetratricopeptide repeat protein [Pyrinomonadaceae bacterium]
MKRALTVFVVLAGLVLNINAQESQLGRVEFPTSGSAKAQAHFLRGLAALHSFWYEEALDAFRESTKIDPDFAMGYWGEAMTYNHPLWSEQDLTAARAVVAKFKETPKVTERERAYLNAVRLLYGEGDKHARDLAYSAAMEKVYRAYPEDLDAAAFYSLSLLGIAGGEKGYRLQARAGAIALEVYQKNPNHPGAAHYIIHAFDDPDHAILALPAARRYASIAPEAHHARHMPSHIFLQLGMWPEAAASNEAAWESSDAWMKRKNLSLNVRDYHSLHWLMYVYLQQGRYNDAEKLLNLMTKVMSESTYDNKLRPGYYENNYANMAAAFVVETERWDLAEKLFPTYKPMKPTELTEGMGGAHGSHSASTGAPTLRYSWASKTLPPFIRGLGRSVTDTENYSPEAELNDLETIRKSEGSNKSVIEIYEREIAALGASIKKDHSKAIELMTKATALEEEMSPPSGPPSLIKPTHELFGEILLRAGKPAEAAAQFKISLQRQPNRARSLLGAARAAAQTGDQSGAQTAYAALIDQWKQADANLLELREARDYLKTQMNANKR